MAAPKLQTTTFVSHEPGSIEQTGLTLSFIADLALKALYFNSMMTAQTPAD